MFSRSYCSYKSYYGWGKLQPTTICFQICLLSAVAIETMTYSNERVSIKLCECTAVRVYSCAIYSESERDGPPLFPPSSSSELIIIGGEYSSITSCRSPSRRQRDGVMLSPLSALPPKYKHFHTVHYARVLKLSETFKCRRRQVCVSICVCTAARAAPKHPRTHGLHPNP